MFGARILRLFRRQSVIAACLLGGASAAIVGNALFLQPGRHPAPFVLTRTPPAPEAPPVDPLIAAIQTELAEQGFYDGPVDGLAGPETRAAILSFEASKGEAGADAPTADLLAALEKTGEPAAEPAPPPVELADASPSAAPFDPRTAAVQSALSRAAYGPLGADGRFGPRTRDAIARFQSDHGLPVTGEISDALIVELRSVGALEEL